MNAREWLDPEQYDAYDSLSPEDKDKVDKEIIDYWIRDIAKITGIVLVVIALMVYIILVI